ncbi:NADP-dependent 3-hydroxy acid dehydrogenase YdfG [Gibbsiella quercinecans]|uniref:Short-chain dehydrogenase n=1 Tax=Gibbsiella quercinecans TaxID=929813 RepID=A0A250AW45_9GAMM|nr:SDR family oxidoreductase [Gibbsiella quercinecans]ATA18157.1 short-chain dehydrogenase [Gibbsiella quercinecans]RLM06726.1 short chain dehydrogenase [Gibbsiella quercinecans]TCT92491.1 NADP-dependent 3-hydroxy acid dehydrogenase YdfG [Gibbsiella quercinecans]
MTTWKTSDIPSQSGRTAVVTGTGGLGLEDAIALAAAGAEVIIAGRNLAKGKVAVAKVRQAAPDSSVCFEVLDLANIESITAFGSRLRAKRQSLDLLINNAAVMMPPQRKVTDDGFELQLGTNYLGHFALTAQLLPLLRNGHNPRVVTLSSIASRNRDASINFDDLQAEREYKPMTVYGQSKLACLMFALELQRRSDAAGWGISSMSAHPGISRTDLLPNGAGPNSVLGLWRKYLWFMFQPAAQGALPTLFAATSPEAKGGTYYGPDKLGETRGSPAIAKIPERALDINVASRLWGVSEELTGMTFGAASTDLSNVPPFS